MNHIGNGGHKHRQETKDRISLTQKLKRIANADKYLTITARRVAGQRLRQVLVETGLREDKCEVCGQPPIWNGLPLVLQVDHINGDSLDSRPENLMIICANCHTQTETFAGRNVKEYKNQHSYKKLLT